MIELLTVICLYPINYGDNISRMTPIFGEVITQKPKLIRVGRQLADGWRIDFTKSLTRLKVLEYNIPVMYINANDCLVKKRKEVDYEPE